MNCPHTVALGGYLLGALEPEDRSTFESHLHGCEICRTELVRLSPLPGLLHQISLEDFEDLPEPDAIPPPAGERAPAAVAVLEAEEPVVLDASRAPDPRPEHRRRYWLVAAAAALVMVLTVGGIIGYRALQEPVPVASGITWSATDPTTGVHGDAELVEHGWGTQVNIRLDHVQPDKPCWLVVKGRDGDKQIAGWWKTESDAVDPIAAPTAYAVEEIAKIEVMTVPDDPDAKEAKRLVTLSPDGHEYPPS